MMKFKNVLCSACGKDGIFAECLSCPMRDEVDQQTEAAETDFDDVTEDDVTGIDRRKEHGYQRRKENVKKRVHQDTVLEIHFPEEFWSKIKSDNMKDLIRQAESWKNASDDGEIVNACTKMISKLKAARTCGGVLKDVWWGADAVMKIKIDFPNKKSLNTFKAA